MNYSPQPESARSKSSYNPRYRSYWSARIDFMIKKYDDDEWLRDSTFNVGYYTKKDIIKSSTTAFADNVDHQRHGMSYITKSFDRNNWPATSCLRWTPA